MAGTATWGSSRRQKLAAAVLAVPIAGLLAGAAVMTRSAGQPSELVAPTVASAASTGIRLIGEHSALGWRLVDELNAALAAMPRARGEHAGLSRAEYEAGAALDQEGR